MRRMEADRVPPGREGTGDGCGSYSGRPPRDRRDHWSIDRRQWEDVPEALADNSTSRCPHPGPECGEHTQCAGQEVPQWIAALHGRCVLVSPTGHYSARTYL